MSAPVDPPRCTDDPAAPPELARLLRGARADGPSEAELAALGDALAPQLGPPPPGGGGAAAPLTRGWWLRTLGVASLAVGIGAGVVALRPQRPPRATAPAAHAAPRDRPASVAPVVLPEAPPAPEQPPGAAPVAPQPPPHVTAAPAVVRCDPEEHLALLQTARSELRRGDPRASLASTARDRARCPHGSLAEERDAVAIESLFRLGRAGEASRRLADFAREHPSSLHLRALHSLLDAGS